MEKENFLNKGLDSLGTALQGLKEMQTNLMMQLTPQQRINYSQFEQNYAMLIKNGDLVGAKNLADKFNEENK